MEHEKTSAFIRLYWVNVKELNLNKQDYLDIKMAKTHSLLHSKPVQVISKKVSLNALENKLILNIWKHKLAYS